MNMFARFDENPAMTLQDFKETKRFGRTDGHTHGNNLLDTPRTVRVSEKTWQVIVRTS